MKRHPYFDLQLHDDSELESLLHDKLVERTTLHEWPLSCVQRLRLAGGRRLIYKSQYGPTVEADVYARARSPLLPWAETVYRAEGHVCMLIEYIDGTPLEELAPSEEETLHVVRELRAGIDAMDGDLPCYLDARGEDEWCAYVSLLVDELHALIESGAFITTTPQMVADLSRWATSARVLSAFAKGYGYVHRDFGGDNVLVVPNGYRVIDWQRPIWGPTDLDTVDMLNSLGYDPLRHIDPGVVEVWLVLSAGWLAEAKSRWFTQGTSYDGQVADLIARLGRLARQA